MGFKTLFDTNIEKNQTIPVGKTLVIGLGGTGKEILLRLRRLIVEKYGQLDQFPCIQFLHLDTDQTTQALQQYDKSSQDDPLYHKIAFHPYERISLTIKEGTGYYLRNIKTYPNIMQWFRTKGKIADLGELGEGASQVRMASRLAFYSNYGQIENGLVQAKARLMSETIRDRMAELSFDYDTSIWNIYVIASLAGGTGSGTFIDMGFLLKSMFPDSRRKGIFFLPSFFDGYPGSDRMKANGYAALMELNHYSFGHSFVSNWDIRRREEIIPPPFEYTYLLESENEAGEGIGSSSEEYSMYQMVAVSIFHDFSLSDFSGLKRATRVNLKNFIDNAYKHNYWDGSLGEERGTDCADFFTTRFCSYGLSTISFPVENVHRACACRLANEILNHWQKNIVDDPFDILFTAFINLPEIQMIQGEYIFRETKKRIYEHHIEDALLLYKTGQKFDHYILNESKKLKTELEKRINNKQSLAFELEDFCNDWDKWMAGEDSNNESDWGQYVRILEKNMENYLTQLKDGIRKTASQMANNSKFGISYVLSILKELKQIIHNENYHYLHYFNKNINYYNTATEDYKSDLDQLMNDIGKHEKQFIFRKPDLTHDISFLVSENEYNSSGILTNYLISRVMKQVAKRGKRVCEAIDAFLGEDNANGGGLLAEYHRLTIDLVQLQSNLSQKEKYYSKNDEYATLKLLFTKEDIDHWYQLWMGKTTYETNLNNLSGLILEDVFQSETVTEALDFITTHSFEAIEDQMIEKCRLFFENHEEQPSALKILFDDKRYSQQQRMSIIQSAYKRSKVWLKPTRRIGHVNITSKPGERGLSSIIGINKDDNLGFRQFDSIVSKLYDPEDIKPQFKNIGNTNKSMIVFYNELAGVPAFYPSSVTEIGGLKDKYQIFCKNPNEIDPKNQEEVHIDKNRFQFSDIIPKTPEEIEDRWSSVYIFVLARILGILDIEVKKNEENEGYTNYYSYDYENESKYANDLEELGNEFYALEAIYNGSRSDYISSHKDYLYNEVDKIIELIKQKNLLPVYLLLIEFYETFIYPEEKELCETRGVKITRRSLFNATLRHEKVYRINRDVVTDPDQQMSLSKAYITLRGKPIKSRPNLSYDEYLSALKGYVKESGKFAASEKRTRIEKVWKNAIVFDIDKLLASESEVIEERISGDNTPSNTAASSDNQTTLDMNDGETDKKNQTRACNACGKIINCRAIFCKHCKKDIARHITCPHCDETKVPDDLDVCWNCGNELQPEKKQMECPRCFEVVSIFPCPICTHDPSTNDSQ